MDRPIIGCENTILNFKFHATTQQLVKELLRFHVKVELADGELDQFVERGKEARRFVGVEVVERTADGTVCADRANSDWPVHDGAA